MTKMKHFFPRVFGYLKSRANRRVERFVVERGVRISSVRDLAFPAQTFEVDFSNKLYGILHSELAGIYELKGLYIHRGSGVAFLAPDENFWPICVAESGTEDYQLLAQRNATYRPLVGFDRDSVPTVDYGRPAFLFNVHKKKKNYYHFMAEAALRLVTFLENYDHPVTILVQPDLADYMMQFLDLLSSIYNCSIEKMPETASHFRVISPLLFMDDVVRRFGNFQFSVDWVQARLAMEPEVNLNGINIDRLAPFRINHLAPKSWKIENNERSRVKNNNVLFLPSKTAVDCLTRFVDRLEKAGRLRASSQDIIYISRRTDSSRGRNIINEDDLLASLPKEAPVNFGMLPLVDQISASRNAKVLIGLHGAGLANALFMREGAVVIEIAPAGQSIPVSNLFENLCALRGLKYQRVFASPLDSQRMCFLDPLLVTDAIAALTK